MSDKNQSNLDRRTGGKWYETKSHKPLFDRDDMKQIYNRKKCTKNQVEKGCKSGWVYLMGKVGIVCMSVIWSWYIILFHF